MQKKRIRNANPNNKNEKNNLNVVIVLLSIIAIVLFLFLIFCFIYASYNKNINSRTENGVVQQDKMQTHNEQQKIISIKENKNPIIDVKVNPPIDLNYKSKEEVFEIRKNFVKESPFYYEGYVPADEPFGQIESSRPWISNTFCIYKKDNTSNIKGEAEESRFLNNPSALVMLDNVFPQYWCEHIPEGETFEFFPAKITYDSEKNIVRVQYKKLPYLYDHKRKYYEFNGINARDFGYRYAYLVPEKSTFIPDFTSEKNISNEIIEFQDHIHLGGSCGVEGGCNNGSPKQDYLEFYYTNKLNKQNQYVYIKLWKERPSSKDAEADIVEIIEIEDL